MISINIFNKWYNLYSMCACMVNINIQFSFVEAPHEFIIAKFFIHKLMVALLAPTNIHACESFAIVTAWCFHNTELIVNFLIWWQWFYMHNCDSMIMNIFMNIILLMCVLAFVSYSNHKWIHIWPHVVHVLPTCGSTTCGSHVNHMWFTC